MKQYKAETLKIPCFLHYAVYAAYLYHKWSYGLFSCQILLPWPLILPVSDIQ